MNQTAWSLNGVWQVVTDDELQGRALHWERHSTLLNRPDVRQVSIPCCLETCVEDFEGVAWFHRAFVHEGPTEGRCLRLRFGAVNYRAEVWLNGHPIGFHEGGYTDFAFEIGDLVVPGVENHLVVRVITPLITRREPIDGLGYNEMPHWRGAITGGIWQDVTLLETGPLYLDRPFACPDLAQSRATIRLSAHNTLLQHADALLETTVCQEDDGMVVFEDRRELRLRPGTVDVEVEAPIPSPRLWSPDAPHLYRVRLKLLAQGQTQDEQSFVFGMREFTARGRDFYLNGEKLLIKAAFYEGYYPGTLAFPEKPELIEKEIRLAKEAGLNLLRPWRKPQPPIVYELADRMGMLMVGAIAVECMRFWPQLSPAMASRIEQDLREMVLRDRNHPCIVMWEVFNEVHRQELKRLRHPMALAARSLDESRMILDESGGFYDGASVYLPGEWSPTVIADVHFYPGAPVNNHTYAELYCLGRSREEMARIGLTKGSNTESRVVPDALTNVTELGYGSSPDLPAVMATYARGCNPLTPDYKIHRRLYDTYRQVLRDTGVMDDFGSLEAWCQAEQQRHAAANKDMLEACRVNPRVAGIGIHAFVDGDWVVGAGMLDIHRRPKAAYYVMKQAFAPAFASARPDRPNCYPGQAPVLACHVASDADALSAPFVLDILDEGGSRVFHSEQEAQAERTAVRLEDLCLGPLPEGRYRVTVAWGPARNETSFWVLRPVCDVKGPLHLYDTCGVLRSLLDRYCVPWREAGEDSRVIYVLGDLTPADGARLETMARAGATVAVLDLPQGVKRVVNEMELADGLLPFPLRTCESFGYWTPNNHVARRGHPLFRHLPTGMMDETYQNVCPRRSVRHQGHDWALGMIGYGWWQDQMDLQNYTGVSGAFDAADVFFRRWGGGRYLLSTLRLRDSLGEDPVADQLFFNLAAWLEGEAGNED